MRKGITFAPRGDRIVFPSGDNETRSFPANLNLDNSV